MMKRRDLFKLSAAAAISAAVPKFAMANDAKFEPKPSGWRSFEVTTSLKPESKGEIIRAWVPVSSFRADDWNRPEGVSWKTNAQVARQERDPHSGTEMVYLEWAANEATPNAEIVSVVSTRDRLNDLNHDAASQTLTSAERKKYLTGTELAPVDGVVKEMSDKIVGSASTDIEKAQKIYDWVVENTYRRAATRGCGEGKVAAILASSDFGGKCADLNPIFVALVRAAGIPARDLYGVRVAPSAFGYKSLGAKNEVITKSQHCRAEIFLNGHGWVAMDPADVRKVMLEEEKDGLTLQEPRVVAARDALFGAWEGNWVAFNDGADVQLPNSDGPAVNFFMYPQMEVGNVRLDCLEPDQLRYAMTVKEITA